MFCKCGFPVPPPPRTIQEGFWGAKRVIEEHKQICPNCKRTNKVKG